MKKDFMKNIRALRPVLMLTFTQGLSALGSAMTSFALIIWAYEQTGSALNAALPAMVLSVPEGGEGVLAVISTVTGVATLVGGAIAAVMPGRKAGYVRLCSRCCCP